MKYMFMSKLFTPKFYMFFCTKTGVCKTYLTSVKMLKMLGVRYIMEYYNIIYFIQLYFESIKR